MWRQVNHAYDKNLILWLFIRKSKSFVAFSICYVDLWPQKYVYMHERDKIAWTMLETRKSFIKVKLFSVRYSLDVRMEGQKTVD